MGRKKGEHGTAGADDAFAHVGEIFVDDLLAAHALREGCQMGDEVKGSG